MPDDPRNGTVTSAVLVESVVTSVTDGQDSRLLPCSLRCRRAEDTDNRNNTPDPVVPTNSTIDRSGTIQTSAFRGVE